MAISANIYNANIQKRDLQVYVCPMASSIEVTEGVTILDTVKDVDTAEGIKTLISGTEVDGEKVFYQVGELLRDSITKTIGEGNSVEGNTLGKIVIDKSCELAMTLININKEVLDTLESLDGKTVCFLTYYKGRATDGSEDEAEFFIDMPFVYNETMTGGEVGSVPISVKKEIVAVSDFSILLPVIE